MTFFRQAVFVAASSFALVASVPMLADADQRPSNGDSADDQNKHQKHNGDGEQGQRPGGERGQRSGGNEGQKMEKPGFGQKQQQNFQKRQFGNGGSGNNPNASGNIEQPNSHKKQFGGQPTENPNASGTQQPQFKKKEFGQQQQPTGNSGGAGNPQQPTFQKKQFGGQPGGVPNSSAGTSNNQFGGANGNKDRSQVQKQFGNQDKDHRQDTKPVVVNPGQPNNPAAAGRPFVPGKSLSAADAKKRFENLRGARKQVSIDGGKGVVIEEPGKRRIIKENNRVVIQHDETERLRRVAPNAHFSKGKGGTNVAVIDRPGGYKVYSETDANGQLLRRYRRGPDGRDVIIIDNRRRRGGSGRSIATGVGIGIGVIAGAAILDSVLDVPEPRVRIPRDRYIVDYDRASDEDVYEALSAPPVEEYRDRYTLDQIRATASLRDRMRRVDLDDITFEFGSWDVDPREYSKLERIARAMRRVIERNPNEVFMIEGYTDAVGTPEDNLSLSDRRAESVAEVLTEQFQVPFENLTTQGYGEQYLKVPTDAPERLNRRVAVRRITPLLAQDGGPPPAGADQGPADDQSGGPDDNGPDGGPDDGGPPPQGSGGPQD